MNRFLLVLLLLAVCVTPSFAWHVNTHLQMTRDAIALMPEEFKKSFTEHQKFVEAGIKDPDELLKDWSNHYYIPSVPEGGALDQIDKLVKVVQIKFEKSSTLDVSKQLCMLAHYIADLWSPESIIRQSTTGDMDFVKNNDILVFYEGYQKPIENIREYLERRTQWRWRLESAKEISPLLYSEAVNDIARTWLTLWQKSGKTVETQKVAVIDHKKGALNVNFERLLLEEEYYWYQWDISSDNWIDRWDSHYQEVERLSESVAPTDESLYAQAELRNQQWALNQLSPEAPFQMLETSLKAIGDKAYFFARVRNHGNAEIPSVAFMHPDVRGPAAIVKNLKPGQITKVEAVLPANATKNQIQLIFASAK